jgi:AraC-like DNA-binding protein
MSLQREWLIFNGSSAVPWVGASRPGGVLLALNFQGDAEIALNEDVARRIRPGMLAWLRDIPPSPKAALRLPSDRHECLCLFYADQWLAEKLATWQQEVPAELRPLLLESTGSPQAVITPLETDDRAWARGLMAPHLCDGARHLLEAARMAEFFVRKLFARPGEGSHPCTRTRRLGLDRITRVKTALRERLDDPPSLAELAQLAGCNPHYLSRTFSAEEGMTISAWLRRLRVETAASLLASGRCNVSEAALEVGYQSLGHFTRAFATEKGVVPSQWVRTLARERDA